MVAMQLQQWPLRRRLTLLIAVSTGITAIVCLMAVLASSLWVAQTRAYELTAGLARMLAEAVHEPMAHGDAVDVEERVAFLRARGEVAGAWVEGVDGRLLARFGAAALPAEGERGGLAKGYVVAEAPVVHDEAVIGRIRVQTELGALRAFMLMVLVAVLLGVSAASVASVLLGRRIARTIAEPVQRLADAASEIAASQDTSRRIPQLGAADELGRATQAFNHMLAELQRHENELLDLRVAERTRELQGDRDRAEAASQAKSSFLSHMSHELRTPLNAVIGAAQLLDAQQLRDASQVPLVAAIRDSGTRLLKLIDDILDLSRIESGSLELAQEAFDVRECLEAALATTAVSARAKGLSLVCRIEPELTRWRLGDPYRLRQILLNLLGNAVKFTGQGGVTLQVETGAQPPWLRISISDSGIGMDETAQRQIFEPFRQADSSTTRRYGGSGLGLAITQELVRAMRGQIRVSSQAGQGSCFVVELPLALAEAAAKASASTADKSLGLTPLPAHCRVLVAEDDPVNQLIVRTLLQSVGCAVSVAESGCAVLEQLARQPFDIVLMDLQMPVMDGLEATRQLRAGVAGEAARRLPVLALTANAFTEDRAACLAAGMDDFLTKPVQVQALCEAIARWVPGAPETIPAPCSTSTC